MADPADQLLPSAPYPLGAYWDGRGTHFAVFSERAERVELCLFDNTGRHERARLRMPECTNGVWHGYLENCRPGQLYGYRVYGPYDPINGLRFNGHKLLLDPYARQLHGDIRWHDAVYGYRIGSPREDLSFDRRDSAAYVPKAIVTDDHFDWGNDHPPSVPWSDTVIYEMHVRGFTRLRNDLPEHDRGTFGALGHPSTIEYLKGLGVTAVELLPIHSFARDRYLVENGRTNYWGYNTLGFFAPDQAYLSDGTLGQLKWAVKQLHAANIEVILDVVYNHTCEGNELGPTLSFRGFGNEVYYRLLPDEPRYHINDTGCGNTVDFSHPRVIQLVMDSLRYWVQEFHIDGFRFDLGVTMGREAHGFDPGAGFFDALLQDPVLARVKLISEPWDIGPDGYQVGNHAPGLAEWNGVYRDDIRRYWRGDEGLRGSLAAALQGSAAIFDHGRRRPWSSVNFITAHDGFTLHDLVSYNHKHNEENGEDNRDGADSNESNNWGAEGPTDDAAVNLQRDKVKRALLATLFCSHGTPMLLAGDEFGQTQQGNNNTYCQDNTLSWLDWEIAASEQGLALRQFVQQTLRVRREVPLLQGHYFQHGLVEVAPGVLDSFWHDEAGNELNPEDWDNPTARLLGLRRAARRPDGDIDIALLLINGDSVTHRFQLPWPPLDYRVVLHSDPGGREAVEDDEDDTAADDAGSGVAVASHSVLVLVSRATPEQFVAPVVARRPAGAVASESAASAEGGEPAGEGEAPDGGGG